MNPWVIGGLVTIAAFAAGAVKRADRAVPDRPTIPVRGIEHIDAAFEKRVIEICRDLGMDPNHLMLIMSFETAGTFDPATRNPISGATGLIQFMPATARALGTTTDELASMTAVQQLSFVLKYFRRYRRLTTLEDAYMAVLWPSAIGKGRDHVLFTAGSIEYDQNRLDVDDDGRITVGEATDRVRQMADFPGKVRVLLVGDSLAVGLAAPLGQICTRAGARIASRGIGGTTIENWGNWTSKGERLDYELHVNSPTMTIISLGTNDMLSANVEAKAPAVNAIVDRVLRAGCAVAWIGPPAMPFADRGVRALLERELGRRNVRLFKSERLDLERAPDKIHMTPRGYADWARGIWEWLY